MTAAAPNSNLVFKRKVDLLKQTRRNLSVRSRAKSIREVSEALREMSPFPWIESAGSATHMLYAAASSSLNLALSVRPLLDEHTETQWQRSLRLRGRRRFYDPSSASTAKLIRDATSGQTTLVHYLRHGSDRLLPKRFNDAGCIPGRCREICLYDTIGSLPPQKRRRMLLQLTSAQPIDEVIAAAGKKGYHFTARFVTELNRLLPDMVPLIKRYQSLLSKLTDLDDLTTLPYNSSQIMAPHALLDQSLKHPLRITDFANDAQLDMLDSSEDYEAILFGLEAIHHRFEHPIRRLLAVLHSDLNDTESSTETSLLASGATAETPKEQITKTPIKEADFSDAGSSNTCVRPGEHNEIRVCMLALSLCAGERGLDNIEHGRQHRCRGRLCK